MTRHLNLAFSVLLAGVAICPTPATQAVEWDKKTILTFNEPVEIPGQALHPETDPSKLAGTVNRTTVEVYREDEQHLVAMMMASAAYRVQRTDKTVVTFEERTAGSPKELHDWFYPGDHIGIEFVYPETTNKYANAQSNPAPAPPSAALASEPDAPPVVEQQTQVEEPAAHGSRRGSDMAQAVPLSMATQNAPVDLPIALPPTTANFAAIPLLGLVLLSGGFTALTWYGRCEWRTRRAQRSASSLLNMQKKRTTGVSHPKIVPVVVIPGHARVIRSAESKFPASVSP